MRIIGIPLALFGAFLLAANARTRDETTGLGAPVRVVVSVEGQRGVAPPELNREDAMAYLDNQRAKVTGWMPVHQPGAGLQLWILIDDGSQTVLGSQLDDLRKFVLQQPPDVEAGVGYINHGRVEVAAGLTTDHSAAAKAFRLPLGLPGISASPYIALTDLIHKWPAGTQAREILMITSGIDPEYGASPQNPYLMHAIETAQRSGVVVNSIYFSAAGHLGHSFWQINWGQNYLSQLAEETGGKFFWLGTTNPVAFAPYLDELNQRLEGQHVLTFLVEGKAGFRRLGLATEIPHVSLVGPSKVYVPGAK